MPDFLTRRNGTWHFVRRVPAEFAAFDKRGIVRHSTKVRVSTDRTGRRAYRVAERFNSELEAFWQQVSANANADPAAQSYESVRQRARSLGFDYIENNQLLFLSPEKRLERLEALFFAGLKDDATARKALCGTEPQPLIPLSKMLEAYEELVQQKIKQYSPNQLRVWRAGRTRVIKELLDVTGDKPITELTDNDGLDYVDRWRQVVVAVGDADRLRRAGHLLERNLAFEEIIAITRRQDAHWPPSVVWVTTV